MAGVGIWVVGKPAPCRVPLTVDGVAITSGTCTIEFSRKNGATIEWATDSTLAAWSSSYTTMAGTSDTNRGFGLDPTVPSAALDYQVDWLVRHSVYGAIGGGSNYVQTAPASGPITLALAP